MFFAHTYIIKQVFFKSSAEYCLCKFTINDIFMFRIMGIDSSVIASFAQQWTKNPVAVLCPKGW